MPIWLRRFTIKTMNEYFKDQNKDLKKNKSELPLGPNIKNPSYTVKGKKSK